MRAIQKALCLILAAVSRHPDSEIFVVSSLRPDVYLNTKAELVTAAVFHILHV